MRLVSSSVESVTSVYNYNLCALHCTASTPTFLNIQLCFIRCIQRNRIPLSILKVTLLSKNYKLQYLMTYDVEINWQFHKRFRCRKVWNAPKAGNRKTVMRINYISMRSSRRKFSKTRRARHPDTKLNKTHPSATPARAKTTAITQNWVYRDPFPVGNLHSRFLELSLVKQSTSSWWATSGGRLPSSSAYLPT